MRACDIKRAGLAVACMWAAATAAQEASPSSDPTPPSGDSWRATQIPGSCVKPEYPQASIRKQEKGTSIIELKLDAEGKVTDASVRQSSGSKLLDQAAAYAMSACRFRPARDSTGTPMASGYLMRHEWRLEDAPRDPWVELRALAGGGFPPTVDFGAIAFAGDSASNPEQRARILQAARDEAVDKAQCPSVERASARVAVTDKEPERRSFESWTLEQCGRSMRYVVAILFPQGRRPLFRMVPLAPSDADPLAAR